MTRLQLMLPQ